MGATDHSLFSKVKGSTKRVDSEKLAEDILAPNKSVSSFNIEHKLSSTPFADGNSQRAKQSALDAVCLHSVTLCCFSPALPAIASLALQIAQRTY